MYVYQYYKIEKTAHPFSHCAQTGNAFRNTHHILQLFRTLPGMKTVSGCEAAFADALQTLLQTLWKPLWKLKRAGNLTVFLRAS